MMNINALQYFIETVRASGFTAAAQTLGVSQSTVSKMIKNLEAEIGGELLVRTGKQFLLTDLGKLLFEQGSDILQSISRLEKELHATQALQLGYLELGIPPMVNLLFTQVIKDFRKHYPNIRIDISEPPGPAVEKLVAAHQLELGFSIAPIDSTLALKQQRIARFAIHAVATTGVLPKSTGALSLAQLHKKPLLLLNDDFGITRHLRACFAQEQLQPNIYAQSSQWDWLLSMAQTGLGIALLPEPFCERLPEGLESKPLENHLHWDVMLLWNGLYLSEAAKAWLSCCQPYFENIETVLAGLEG